MNTKGVEDGMGAKRDGCPKCGKPMWGEGWNPETGLRYFSHVNSDDAAGCVEDIEIQGAPKLELKGEGDHINCPKHGPKFGFCEDCIESPEELPHRVKIALRRIMNRIEVIKNGGDFDVRDEQFIENELLDVWDHHSILPSAAVPVEEPVAWMYRAYVNIGSPRESWELSEPRVTTDLEKTQGHPSGHGKWPLAEVQPLYLHPQPAVPVEERTAEMKQLMASLRLSAKMAGGDKWSYDGKMFILAADGQIVAEPRGFGRGMDVNIAVFIADASPENILKLLDHIEPKPILSTESIQEVKE